MGRRALRVEVAVEEAAAVGVLRQGLRAAHLEVEAAGTERCTFYYANTSLSMKILSMKL